MSIKLMSMIWEYRGSDLTASQTSVLLRMADFAADDGTSIYPSRSRIADDTKLSKRMVRYNIESLIANKFLILEKAGIPGKHKTNRYRINIDKLSKIISQNTNKPVDKLVKKTLPSATIAPGASATIAPGASATIAPDPSITTTIKNHHIGHTAQKMLKAIKEKTMERDDQVVVEFEFLIKEGCNRQQARELFEEHGKDKCLEAVKIKQESVTVIYSPYKYMKGTLKKMKALPAKKGPSMAFCMPHRTTEETTAMMKAQESKPKSKEPPAAWKKLVDNKR